jgi:uncharacterized protein (DUF4213/DUF364 family)
MTDVDTKQLIVEILNKAQEGRALSFRQILYWTDYVEYLKLARSTKLIIKTLETSAKNLFKEYCKDVIAGISDINKILAYSQLLDIVAFYKNELKTIRQMIDDYDEYLGDGHFWYSFLGGQRDIWNFR